MQIYLEIIKNHLLSIIFYLFSIIIITLFLVMILYVNHTSYLEEQMNNNIFEYQEIDREHLCRLSQCEYVLDKENGNWYVMDEHTLLEHKIKNPHTEIEIFNNLYLLKTEDHIHIALYNLGSDSLYLLNNDKFITVVRNTLLWTTPFLFLIYLFPLIISIRIEKEQHVLNTAGSEALMANNSMIMITENIHHELNTPLEVIDNKIEKIHRLIKRYVNVNDNYPNRREIDLKYIQLEEDFNFIKMSTEQIYNILEKMKEYKHLRYSNGNKSLLDIVSGAFKMIEISNSDYTYEMDKELINYGVAGKITNSDLLNVFINHIKNSLEAGSSKVYVVINSVTDTHINVRIIDNGDGIDPKSIKSIFSPNFSTKTLEEETRGNGMYLNKHLMVSNGGNVSIVDTSRGGTTIEIKIPVYKK